MRVNRPDACLGFRSLQCLPALSLNLGCEKGIRLGCISSFLVSKDFRPAWLISLLLAFGLSSGCLSWLLRSLNFEWAVVYMYGRRPSKLRLLGICVCTGLFVTQALSRF
jgi:hypothetical protein